MPPESIDAIITGTPSDGDAPQTLKELGRFGSHALKPNGALLLLCPSHLLPLPLRNVEQRGLNFLTEFDYRFDVPHQPYGPTTPGGGPAYAFAHLRQEPVRAAGRRRRHSTAGGERRLQQSGHGKRRAAGTGMIVRRFTQPGDLVCDPLLLTRVLCCIVRHQPRPALPGRFP